MKVFAVNVAVFLSTVTSALAQTSSSPPIGNCTIFNWNQQPAYLVTYPGQRISAAQTCPSRNNESHACPIRVTADQQLTWDYNISTVLRERIWPTKDGSGSFPFNLINSSLPAANESSTATPFVDVIVGNIDTISELPPGTSGYLELSPYYQCYAGTMSNCTGDLTDGVGIEACAPLWHTTRTSNALPIFDGELSIRNVSANNISSYPDPFAGLVRSGAGGHAASLGGSTAWLGFACMFVTAISWHILS